MLVKSDLRDVVKLINLSHAVLRNIKQNLFWALCYNAVCIPIAAGVLYPLWHIKLTPMFGAAAMSFSSGIGRHQRFAAPVLEGAGRRGPHPG